MKIQLNRQNINSLIFSGLLLILCVIGREDKDNLTDNSLKNNINQTSLVASVKSVASPVANRQINQTPSVAGVKEQENNYDFSGLMPAVSAKGALVADLDNGFEFFNLNATGRWPIASITKFMTAIVAYENVGADKIVAVNETAVASESAAGNLKLGESYKVAELVKIMLSVSSNDAAVAISDFYGEANFVEVMQKKAFELEMSQTTFHDSTGLSFLNQSTATDIMKLVKYIISRYPGLLEITRLKTVGVLEIKSGAVKTLTNINNFAGGLDFIGGKTGFIDSSGGNLVSVFNYLNHKILIIVFGADDRFNQTELLYNWIKKEFKF